ncbi:uncharacterized protein LOC128275287 [Anopheles cruzii]|uniref:uncharacterized protein LOC128275287 n=1 Tax=Anopheles cruzii TaxID=68878 RepID=UPI0022EC7837|nr:uncharacterized protein LOC128275287 [Anopheles cruzii]
MSCFVLGTNHQLLFQLTLTLPVVVMAIVSELSVASAEAAERRRPLFRRAKPSTTQAATTDDSEGSETKIKTPGKDLYTVSDSFSIAGNTGTDAAPSGSFAADGEKLSSFSEYSFGSTKLSAGSDFHGAHGSDEESPGYGAGFKNHKTNGLLPTTYASNKERKQGPFDFLAGDYAKPKGSLGNAAGIQHSNASLLGSKLKLTPTLSASSSAISSKFSISHSPATSGSKVNSKLAHLDDSTEYDVYSSLGHSSSSSKSKVSGASSKYRPLAASTSFTASGLDGKVKKVPFKYEDGAGSSLAAGAGKGKGTKTKLALEHDGGNVFGGFEEAYGKHQQQQQHGFQGSKGSKFNFAEPPPLVKSTLNTLKHFGEGLLGNGPDGPPYGSAYEVDSDESGLVGLPPSSLHSGPSFGPKYGSPSSSSTYFGHFGASPTVAESHEVSGERAPGLKSKFPKSSLSLAPGGKFATDFDVKNIKLTDSAQQQHHHYHVQHPHASHATTGSIDNPNPQDFRPNFPLQDVRNLYPAAHLGASIATKGQIESFLKSEHGAKLKDESLVGQLLGDQSSGAAASRPGHYHQLEQTKEDSALEKEALRQQIEYLKAQSAKHPVDLSGNPNRPPIVSNAQKFRPVRRIPLHVRLGVKAPYPLPRIPHFNDRPYSISFKI